MTMSAERSATVLVVDDEAGVRELMSRWLRGLGYDVVAAANAEDALRASAERAPAVALCDIRMPGRDGLWLAEQLRHAFPEVAIVVATGIQDVGSAMSSLRTHATDYLMKPFGRDRLREAVERAMTWHRAAADGRGAGPRWLIEMRQRRDQIAQALAGLQGHWRTPLEAALGVVRLYDEARRTHVRRVADASAAVARGLGRPSAELDVLERAAFVHELEKLALPDQILAEQGPLTPLERDLVREAPALGRDLLGGQPLLADAAPIVYARHEHWDGSGYPCGIAGEAIPVPSRILAVVDTYDTMVRTRSALPAPSWHETVSELRRSSGRLFDPEVVAAFERVVTGVCALSSR
jgi:response regulator RpfG family c-di-GMP phosphodiesterase